MRQRVNACWKPLLPQMVQIENDISASVTEILSIASGLSGEGFADLSHEDVEELLRKESLNEEELLLFIDASTSNVSVEENADNESVTNVTLDHVKNGLDLAKQLELHFTQNDPSTVRSGKFKRELQNCLAPYKKLLTEL